MWLVPGNRRSTECRCRDGVKTVHFLNHLSESFPVALPIRVPQRLGYLSHQRASTGSYMEAGSTTVDAWLSPGGSKSPALPELGQLSSQLPSKKGSCVQQQSAQPLDSAGMCSAQLSPETLLHLPYFTPSFSASCQDGRAVEWKGKAPLPHSSWWHLLLAQENDKVPFITQSNRESRNCIKHKCVKLSLKNSGLAT
jgi:hypothetical protein